MGRQIVAAVLLVLASLLLAVGPAAAETVRFQSVAIPPTSFRMRLAQERGEVAQEQPGDEIAGDLYRPNGVGPFPAVVALHGCGGRFSQQTLQAIAERFSSAGYVFLAIDSFGPRGIRQRCAPEPGPPADRVMDAFGGLDYLASLAFVDLARVAVVGFSQGANAALSTVAADSAKLPVRHRFAAAVAYYPSCRSSAGLVSVPTLILIGELDDWTPARNCRDMMAHRTGEGASERLVIYPGAYHAFNVTGLQNHPRDIYGHHLEYNEAADLAAAEEVRKFLLDTLGR